MQIVDRARHMIGGAGAARPAQEIGQRETIDLGREWAEAVAIRIRLAGQRQGEQRAAVEAWVERQDGRAPGGAARDLDGVLDRFGTRVEERRLLRSVPGRDGAELFGERHVRFVWRHHEAGAGEPAASAQARTRGAAWPAFVQPMPPEKSRKTLPSTSVKRARNRDRSIRRGGFARCRRDPLPARRLKRCAARGSRLQPDGTHPQYHPTGASFRLTHLFDLEVPPTP